MSLPAWNQLTPLQEKQEDYEPEQEEIQQFAEYLGIDLASEKHLMGLAREGLTAPLPPFWQACEGPDGELYFRNRRSRQITDQNPLDELYRDKVVQMRGLSQQVDTINEESAINESSGIIGSRLAGREQQQRQFEHHITEESVYSQQSEEDEAVTSRRLAVGELRRRVDCFVPSKEKLLTYAANLEEVVGAAKAQKLAGLRLQIEQRKSLLRQLKQQKQALLLSSCLLDG